MMNPKNPRPLVSSATDRGLLGGLSLERVLVPDAVDSVLNLREIRATVFEGAFYVSIWARPVVLSAQSIRGAMSIVSSLPSLVR